MFEIENPVNMARIILQFGIGVSEHNAKLLLQLDDHPELLDEIIENLSIYQRSVERMLNAPENSVIAFNKEFFEAFKVKLVNSK